MAFERDTFALGEIEERDFVVGAGEEHVAIELVDVYDVGVLVGVEFISVLVGFVSGVVFVV